jgi:ribosome-associated translation inhibitor RaiA/cold shock CspA family protein
MEKSLQIAFKDMESSAFLENLIRERVERLERFHPNIVACRVVVEVPHRSTESGKPPIGIAIEIEVPGRKTVVAKDEDDRREKKNDHTAVINRVFDAARRQLEKFAEIQSGAVKQHESSGETGVVVGLFPQENYGFVEVKGSPDLYFTGSAVTGVAFSELKIGTMVMITRAATDGPMGPQASSVRRLEARNSG